MVKDKDAIRSLFSADNPFRRKPSSEEEYPAPATPLRKYPNPDAGAAEPSSKKKREEAGEGQPRRKRKRDEAASRCEGLARDAVAEQPPAVGAKRKAPDDAATAAAADAGEEDDAFDDESKLLRTVFVGNLPLRTKRKALTKEFAAFGQVESVRIRSVPIIDVSSVALPSSLFHSTWNGMASPLFLYALFAADQDSEERSHNEREGQ
jgi:nucleolar protein 12